MIIGFTGTRHGMSLEQIQSFRQLIAEKQPTGFHHGSCCGADVEAARIVRDIRKGAICIEVHPGPEGDLHQTDSGQDNIFHKPKTHFARNRDIVDICDMLIACPLEMERQERGGT